MVEEVLILYFGVGESSISSVLIKEKEGVQKLIYFVSKVLQGPEKRYTEIEKATLAIMVTAWKLRP